MAVIELASGIVVGARYRLERLLGEGGMGVVWACEDIATGQRVALKLMKDPASDPDARERFLREARAASAVRHPNVVGILEVLEPEGEPPAIAMELLDGESLRARLGRRRKLALAELAEIMVPVISAVGAAHALGIVHRDLKPENIFLAREVTGVVVVKVLDFGIAKLTALDGDVMRSTGITTGAVLGTPAYMAPEQVFAEKDLDHRADVWALAVILYECLSGVCPTAGDNVGQVLKHVVARPFEPLHQLVPDLPPSIAQLVVRMLARERSHRPSDLHEVLEILAPFARTPAVPFGAPAPHAKAADGRVVPGPRVPPEGRRADAIDPLAETVRKLTPARRARRRAAVGGAAVVVLLGAITVRSCGPASSPSAPSVVAASPLDPADARIACPILRASGVDTPAGWLGAATAAVACERARVFLGGRPERTLVPAELLDLPRGPVDAFRADPYGEPDARERSITAARQRAQAYLDGEVTWSSAGFAVALSLHRSDGSEIKRAAGRGRGLYEAVRSAMTPLIGAGQIPKARELEPEIAAWARTKDIDDALGVLDLKFAFSHNAGGLPEECRRFDELSARVGELGVEGRWLCAYALGQPMPAVEMDDTDRSAAAVATRIRINYRVHQQPADASLVHALFEREVTPRGRAVLAGIEACLLTDPEQAREKARLGVQSEPKSPDGDACYPWGQLLVAERDGAGADAAVRAMQAWQPWDNLPWLELGSRSRGRDPAVLPLLVRAYRLAPFDAQVADTLASSHLTAGDGTAARGIAAELRSGGFPVHEVQSDLILARVDTSTARFGVALEGARRVSEHSEGDTGWVRAQRFEAAWQAFELADLLGRHPEVADMLVARFLDPDTPPLDGAAAVVPTRMIAICARASASIRCFKRFRSLRQRFPAITQEAEDFLTGAERYVNKDFSGAARAWRPLLGGRLMQALALPGAMVDVLERTDAPELAERVDQEVMKRAGELNGATLGHVRAARRAFARGDPARARQLAEQVIRSWSLADELPPGLDEMRRLLRKLPRPVPPVSLP